MGRIYFLDLSTLLTYFQYQESPCVLKTTFKTRSITGYVMIEKGKVIRSLVLDMRGNTISNDQEHEALWQSNEWEVVLPSEIPPQLQQRATEPLALKPRAMQSHSSEAIVILLSKKRDISDRELADLSVKQRMQLRMVLTMINGQRTSDQLKATIRLPGQLIDEILFYLFSIDAIE